jgi:hypothetical protein
MGILILGSSGMTCKKKNQPPGAPSIPSGPTSGRRGDTLRFSTIAEDPDGDSVAVRFDWGDSTMSDWSPLVRSGDSVAMTHAWQKLATYSIRTQARGIGETASVWSGEHQLVIAQFPLSFSKTYGGPGLDAGNSVQPTRHGGYIFTGITTSYGAGGYDIWLVKTDAAGNKTWDRTFGGTGEDMGKCVQQTSDGGYIIAGYTTSFGSGSSDAWLIKIDEGGDVTWDRTFGGTSWDEGDWVQQTADGGYIATGCTRSMGLGCHDVWLVKTDASGNKLWDRTYGGTSEDAGCSVEQTSDLGYIIAGWTWSFGAGNEDLWLVRTDSAGNELWSRTFGGMNDEEGLSVRQTEDGGFIVAGWTSSYGDGFTSAWLVRVDDVGNKVWDRTFGEGGYAAGRSVQLTSDGGYIVVGDSSASYAGCPNVWLIKTDSAGGEVWNRAHGGSNGDWGCSVAETADGGYVIAGATDSYGAADAWLIKTDAEGN